MRILLVSDHYPPFVGGVQRQTRAMAMELSARGHDVGVVTVWQDNLPSYEEIDGFPVWRLQQLRSVRGLRGRPRRRHQPPGPDPVTVLQLRRIVKQFHPDLVHSSGWFTYSAAAALLFRRVPLVVSVREYGFICTNASLLHKGEACAGPSLAKCMSCSRWYHGTPRGLIGLVGVWCSLPLLRRKAVAVHSVSQFVEDAVVTKVFKAKRRHILTAVIPSFRAPLDAQPDESLLAKLPQEPFILFVGALRRVKGVKILFDAYESLPDAPPLVLLGTFERDTPTHIPLGAVALGPVSYSTVMAAWRRCLFGVMPSLWPEPFGSVVHEAMVHGKAVIGTVPGGHSDMIEDGRSGLLVPSGDLAALRTAMERLIGDSELRARLGRGAADRAAAFSAEAVIPQFDVLYARVQRKGEMA